MAARDDTGLVPLARAADIDDRYAILDHLLQFLIGEVAHLGPRGCTYQKQEQDQQAHTQS